MTCWGVLIVAHFCFSDAFHFLSFCLSCVTYVFVYVSRIFSFRNTTAWLILASLFLLGGTYTEPFASGVTFGFGMGLHLPVRGASAEPGVTPHSLPKLVGTASEGGSTKVLRHRFVLTVLNASLSVLLTLRDN